MGCVSSKGDINDQHPNIFQVMNVNESYQLISPGQIEITEHELLLHQRGKPPTKWPLRCLRKYGFDSEIFSFECGRRGPTGPGIYAFRCRKAEQLFNLLQHNIQLRNSEDININLSELAIPAPAVQRRPPPEGYLNPTGNANNRPTLSRPGSITSSSPISPVSVSTPPLEHNNNKRASLEHSYLNTTSIEENSLPYVNLNTAAEPPQAENTHLYVNINTTDNMEVTLSAPNEEDPKHNYANLDGAVMDVESVPATPTATEVVEVNYVELDLDPGKNEQIPPESPSKSKSYVTIDFNKTNALSQSINPRMEVEEGSRKTRHNSTISEVRHSSSISD